MSSSNFLEQQHGQFWGGNFSSYLIYDFWDVFPFLKQDSFLAAQKHHSLDQGDLCGEILPEALKLLLYLHL